MSDSRLPEKDGDRVVDDDRRVRLDEHVGLDFDEVGDAHNTLPSISQITEPPIPGRQRATGFNADGRAFFYSTYDANDKLLIGGDRAAHYADLISRGWRAVRWAHPEHGVMENTATGGWKWTTDKGTTIEDAGFDRKLVINGRLIAVEGRKVKEASEASSEESRGEREPGSGKDGM